MLSRGFLVSGGFYPMLTHEDRHVDSFLAACDPVFADMSAGIAKDDDNARACVKELLGLDVVGVPGAPVVAGRLDHRIAAEVHAVEVRGGRAPPIPDDVFVELFTVDPYRVRSGNGEIADCRLRIEAQVLSVAV